MLDRYKTMQYNDMWEQRQKPKDNQRSQIINSLPCTVKVMFSVGGPNPAEVLALTETLYGMYTPAYKRLWWLHVPIIWMPVHVQPKL